MTFRKSIINSNQTKVDTKFLKYAFPEAVEQRDFEKEIRLEHDLTSEHLASAFEQY